MIPRPGCQFTESGINLQECRSLRLPAPRAVCCLVRVPTAVASMVLLELRLMNLAEMLRCLYRLSYGNGLSVALSGVLGIVASVGER